MNMLVDFMGGSLVGVLFAFISYIVFYDDKQLSKVQLDDYYRTKCESEYHKREYHKIRFLLEHINDDDIEYCTNDVYNHFIIKKEENSICDEIVCFDDLKKLL